MISLKRLLAQKRFNNTGDWILVRVSDSLDLYLPGGGPARAAFLYEVHEAQPFADDGVSMHPDDVRHTSTVGEYNDAIKQWYRNNGYTLTP